MMRGNLQNSDEGNAAATRTGCAFARGRDAEEEGGWLCGKTVEGGPGLPAIALGAIGGNRVAVELGLVHSGMNPRRVGAGMRVPATTVEREQTERNDQENAQVHPTHCDKRSHQLEQIVHFTSPPSLVFVRLDHECEPFGRWAALHGARLPRLRANSVPPVPARLAGGAARLWVVDEMAPSPASEVAFP
jgi:hypothetical protein